MYIYKVQINAVITVALCVAICKKKTNIYVCVGSKQATDRKVVTRCDWGWLLTHFKALTLRHFFSVVGRSVMEDVMEFGDVDTV